MRTEKTVLAGHMTFEKTEGKREAMLYVSNGKTVSKISQKKIETWADAIPGNATIRMTSVHAQDPMIADLIKRGHKVVYTNWHDTGLAKNLPPQEIAAGFAALPTAVFRKFVPRPDLTELRYHVSNRQAAIEYRKAFVLKIRGACRLVGEVNSDEISDTVKNLLAEAEKIDIRIPVKENGKEKMLSIDTVIANLASEIRECQLFNAAAHIGGSWNTAAAVVGLSGGIDRFDNVASFWKYCGEHVVDGKAPKRKKGQAINWNPKIRTILWQMSDSIIKNRSNPWRDYYEQVLAQELAQHPEKCPGCETPQGHCGGRARRKMRKEILKRFFLACKGEEYSDRP